MLKLLVAVAITAGFVTVIFAQVDASSDVPDHYLLYQARASENESVDLVDQFTGPITQHSVKNLALLGNPADKSFAGYDSGVEHPETHLTGYRVSRSGPPANVVVTVTNQFGSIDVRVGKPRILLVPASKSLDDDDLDPLDGIPISHFNCYETRLESSFSRLQVTVDDQFTQGDKVIGVTTPQLLCAPTEKTHDAQVFPILNDDAHLMCYRAKLHSSEPLNNIVDPVWVNDQFSFDAREIRSDTRKPVMLCVPSEKIVLP